jgi:hypothetical protein
MGMTDERDILTIEGRDIARTTKLRIKNLKRQRQTIKESNLLGILNAKTEIENINADESVRMVDTNDITDTEIIIPTKKTQSVIQLIAVMTDDETTIEDGTFDETMMTVTTTTTTIVVTVMTKKTVPVQSVEITIKITTPPPKNPTKTQTNHPKMKRIRPPVIPVPVTVAPNPPPPHPLVHHHPVDEDLPPLPHRHRVTPAAHDHHPTRDPHHLPAPRMSTDISHPIVRLKRSSRGKSLRGKDGIVLGGIHAGSQGRVIVLVGLVEVDPGVRIVGTMIAIGRYLYPYEGVILIYRRVEVLVERWS